MLVNLKTENLIAYVIVINSRRVLCNLLLIHAHVICFRLFLFLNAILREPELEVPKDCNGDGEELEITLPFDYSNTAEFYVATGVLSFLYTLAILVVYIFFHQTYAQNNRVPVIVSYLFTCFCIIYYINTSNLL